MQQQFGYDAITAARHLGGRCGRTAAAAARKPVAILQSAGPACRICQLSSVSTRVKNPAHHDNRRILPSESNQRRLQHRARRRRPRLCPSGFRWVGASGFRSFHVALGGDTRWRRRAKHRRSPTAAIRVLDLLSGSTNAEPHWAGDGQLSLLAKDPTPRGTHLTFPIAEQTIRVSVIAENAKGTGLELKLPETSLLAF